MRGFPCQGGVSRAQFRFGHRNARRAVTSEEWDSVEGSMEFRD